MFKQKKKTKEISFVYSLIIILIFFVSSSAIIYYTTVGGQALGNKYVDLMINRDNSSSKFSNIILTSPRPNDLLSDNFILTGRARIFTDRFYYRVKNGLNEILLQGNTFIRLTGEYLPFLIEINLDTQKITNQGEIEFFIVNSFDGSEQKLLSVPVRFIIK